VSSAGLVLAALIGAIIARRRTRRAQRTIQSLQSLSVIKTPPIMIVGALLGTATANTFGFTLQLFAYGLMIAMALEQTKEGGTSGWPTACACRNQHRRNHTYRNHDCRILCNAHLFSGAFIHQ
jgi:hypothetical protein